MTIPRAPLTLTDLTPFNDRPTAVAVMRGGRHIGMIRWTPYPRDQAGYRFSPVDPMRHISHSPRLSLHTVLTGSQLMLTRGQADAAIVELERTRNAQRHETLKAAAKSGAAA